MKTPATLAAVALIACACVTQPDRVDYEGTGRFVAMDWATGADEQFPPNPDRPVAVNFQSRQMKAGFNPIPGLARMPFGQSMHGPWDVGNYGPDPELYDGDDKVWARWILNRDSDGAVVDFVRKDIHTVMHYIALHTQLMVIVEGDIEDKLTVSFHRPQNRQQAIDLLRAIAILNDLDCVIDGEVIIIKRRRVVPQPIEPVDDKYNVNFENHGLIDALMVAARATGAHVFIPSERPKHIPEARITLQLENATPDQIFREIARLGNLEIEEIRPEEDGFEFVGYRFRYKE